MPRKPRIGSSTGFYHWINRGVVKKKLFHSDRDFRRFFELVKEHKDTFSIKLYHYCLMSNHIHMLLYAPTTEDLSRFSHYLQRRYAYYYCKTHKWAGPVFQSRYKAKPIEKEAHLLECGRYIERNPIKAGLVKRPQDYAYSSYSHYAQCKIDTLLTKSPAYLSLASQEPGRRDRYREYVLQERVYDFLIEKELMKS